MTFAQLAQKEEHLQLGLKKKYYTDKYFNGIPLEIRTGLSEEKGLESYCEESNFKFRNSLYHCLLSSYSKREISCPHLSKELDQNGFQYCRKNHPLIASQDDGNVIYLINARAKR